MENTAGVNKPNRLYTYFEPYCIWHRKEDSDTLDVHLDGFIKEQLKVQINNARILTISGQRPLNDKNDNNKWSRFRKQIKLADNAEDKDIRSKLCRGILSIVMPKKPGILSFSIPVYTDFEPHCIWHRNEDSDTLDVHLDDFIKEQLKVQINNERILTISGERPQKDKNEWNRFRKEIKLADNTKDNDIRANLARGILSIVMPKKPNILSSSIPLPSNVLQTAQTQDVLVQSKPPEKATMEATQKGAQPQDVSAQSKPPEKATTATTQKGNDTVSSSENAELSGMKLGSYLLGQKESGGWMLKMDENMGVKVGLVLVFLLLGVWCLCKMFM